MGKDLWIGKWRGSLSTKPALMADLVRAGLVEGELKEDYRGGISLLFKIE